MSQRFFRCSSGDQVYEAARMALDSAWGHVPPKTCIAPAAFAPRDDAGRIVLAVRQEFTEYSAAAEMLPDLLASGAVEEIDEETYRSTAATPGE
jgi:hypothetical protein